MSNIHFNKEEGSQLKLFTPGPVQVSERILKEMAKPNDTHRSKAYEEMHQIAVEGLQKLLFTNANCFLFSSSATGIMEACVTNLLNKDEKGLFLSIGAFGDRWYEVAIDNGRNGVKESVEWGKALKPSIVEEVLSRDKYAVVFLQSNETSTGVYNPIYDLLPIIKNYGALACVDATSSMAGVKIEVDKLNVDVCLASVQKCLSLPPGLSVCSVSERAIEKAKNVKNRGHYFDFLTYVKKNAQHQTPNTPPIPQIRGLITQLDFIFNEEGLEKRFERHERLGKRTRIWARDMLLEMFSEKNFESNTVSTMKNTIQIDFAEMVKIMLEKGYRITNGYGNLANKTFRIGHMGDIQIKDLEEMLKVLTDVISELRLKKIS